jgi:glycosyltransferase involved in cell wall biosynthesis
MPCLSIVLPTHNRVEFLAITLDSLARQVARLDPADIEILIVDNASTDATPQLCARYPQFGYTRNPELLSPDRSLWGGLRRITGTYAWIVCDDDFIHDDALSSLMAMVKGVGSRRPIFLLNYAQVDQTGQQLLSSGVCPPGLPDSFPTLLDFLPVDGSFDIMAFWPAQVFPRAPFVATDLDMYSELGGYNTNVGPLLQAFGRTEAVYVGRPLLTQRQGNQRQGEEYGLGATFNPSVRMFLGDLMTLQVLNDRFGLPPDRTMVMRQKKVGGDVYHNALHFLINASFRPALAANIGSVLDPKTRADIDAVVKLSKSIPDEYVRYRIDTILRFAVLGAEARLCLLDS